MASTFTDDRNAKEIAYWNGPGGERWVSHQRMQDALLAPVAERLMERAAARAGEFVLDIGCGAGTTSIALARQVAPTGRVLGVDVSAPLLERARQHAPAGLPVEFALGDATVYPFEPDRADVLFSRFGVMFFREPARSFTNMRGGLRSGGRVVFACWREPRENPWMMTPLQAVYKHVPKMPPVGPEDPGPFAFAAEERVRRILNGAGFADVAMEPHNLAMDIAIGRGLDAAVDGSLQIGPASRALQGHPPAVVDAAKASIREALSPFVKGPSVLLQGSIWIVTARAS